MIVGQGWLLYMFYMRRTANKTAAPRLPKAMVSRDAEPAKMMGLVALGDERVIVPFEARTELNVVAAGA